MKWTQKQLNSALNGDPSSLPPVILIYGDDSGAVRQASQRVLDHTGVDLDDPFAADRLDAADLASEPAKLAESAGTVSLMGGVRVIKVEGLTGDLPANTLTGVANAVKGCLETPLKDVVIVIPAPRVGKDHALAKAVEKDKQAAGLRCFQDSIRDLGAYISQTMRAAGKNIQSNAQALLVENLGADRDITLQELNKLITYVGKADTVTEEDVAACLADAPATNIFKLCDAVGGRNRKQVDTLVALLLEEGEDPNMLFTMVIRHLRRLLEAKEYIQQGRSESDAMRALSPPVLFGQQDFSSQLRAMSLPRLQQVVSRALEAQFDVRDDALPPEVHFRRSILALSM